MRSALAFFLTSVFLRAQESSLKIAVLEGQDAINNVNQPLPRDLAVQVRSASDAPVEGAAVTFFLPSQGPGGTFANGTNTLTITTARDGRAVARGIRLNHQTGKFDIRVAASYQGQTASAIITQTNVAGVSTSRAGPSSKVWIILAVAAGAAAAGAFAATHIGGSSSSSNAPIVITPGTPTVGGPH